MHLFRNVIQKLRAEGHKLIITARDKDISLQLLNAYSLDYYNLGKNRRGIIGKLLGLVYFDLRLLRIALKHKPDIFISHSSMYAAQVAWLTGSISITLEDTGNLEQIRLYRAFTNLILSPQCLKKNLGSKHLHYKGMHELAYLHPDNFAPAKNIKQELGLAEDEKYVIIRFVGHHSSHDIGRKTLNNEDREAIVRHLKKHARVFISAETQLSDNLKPYQFSLPSHKLLDALASADLYFGDSGTMASEAAVLGVPAIYLDYIGRDYTDYQQTEYGLLHNFVRDKFDPQAAVEKATELLSSASVKYDYQKKRQLFLNDHIDVTEYLCQLLINCPAKRKDFNIEKIKSFTETFAQVLPE